jgi:purine-binding chemotaxis protein CheW
MNEDSRETVQPAAEKLEQESIEVLVFQLDQFKFSLEIDRVTEIIRFREPTHVPNTVLFLEGIISFRGKMVPVINGRKRLGCPSAKPDLRTSIIVVQDGTELYGILVDSALQVIALLKSEIIPASSQRFQEFILGVFTHKNQNIYLLNLESFLQF